MIKEILKVAVEKNASDVILSGNAFPSLKLDGKVVFLEEYGIISADQLNTEISILMNEKNQEKFREEKELDFSIDLKGVSRFRVNLFVQKRSYGAVFRPIHSKIPVFEDLNIPAHILNVTNKKRGLVLVTGSVGSGKSTTLSAMLNHINKTQSRHIITIEDPVEFLYENDKSLIEQREVGVDTKSFDNGLKYALRQSSDVLMVGEMRDIETFRLALRAAETGNLVFATLHTSGAAKTISRIIDMFPGDEKDQIRSQLSESLVAVIWQDLVVKKGGGRVPAIEYMVNNTTVSNMIRKGLTHQLNSAIETGASEGMIPMAKSLNSLKEKGFL